ncbi:hypothetical protein Hanom_Chr05g00416281 [Helianthus anomalus]
MHAVPNKMFEVVGMLTRWQRNVVRKMGFGKILKLKVSDINASLAYFVVDRLDTVKMEINLGDRQIKIDKECIRKIMGVPYGGIRVGKDVEGCSDAVKVVETWKNWYVKKICYEDEEMFKMDFAMLFIATMIASTKNGHTMYTMLEWFCLLKEFKEHDWCQLIMDTIRVCKSDWDRYDCDSFFLGPLIVVVLLYLDSTTCPGFAGDRLEAPISFWTKDMISLRKDMEIKNGGFGLGDVRELYGDDEDYEHLSDDEVVDLSKETTKTYMQVLMGCRLRYVQMFDEADGLKRRLEEVVGQLAPRFPNSEVLLPALERYKVIFNKSVVVDKGEPSSVKSDVGQKKVVLMRAMGSQLLMLRQLLHKMLYSDVLQNVLSSAYDTQRMDDMPSFDLGLSQPLSTTQELEAIRKEPVQDVELVADVGDKVVDIKPWLKSKDITIWRYFSACGKETQYAFSSVVLVQSCNSEEEEEGLEGCYDKGHGQK